MIYGARITICIALAATALSFSLGVMPGLLRGGLRRLVRHTAVARCRPPDGDPDPDLRAGRALGAAAPRFRSLILVIALPRLHPRLPPERAPSPSTSSVLDFVEAARLRGEGRGWIIVREILPNAAAAAGLPNSACASSSIPVHLGAVLPRPRRPAAGSPTGAAWSRKTRRHHLRQPRHAAHSGGGDRASSPSPSTWSSTGSCHRSAAAARPMSRSPLLCHRRRCASRPSHVPAPRPRRRARRRRLPDARPRRGARPDRRIGRRQIDHRPCRDGLWPRPGCASPAAHRLRRPRHLATLTPTALRAAARRARRLCRAKCRRRLQPGAPPWPAGRRGPGAPSRHRLDQRAPAERGGACSRSSTCPNPAASASAIRTRSPAASCSAP